MSEPERTPPAGILEAIRGPYGLGDGARAEPLGNGHINQTVLVHCGQRRLVAQRINTAVFPKPGVLVHNARLIEKHLEGKPGSLRVVRHLAGRDGRFLHGPGGDIRVLEYVADSRSIEVPETADQAYRAARAFARFSRQLADFDNAAMETVIPDFHSPLLRWRQFLDALQADRVGRTSACQPEIEFALSAQQAVEGWQRLMDELPRRVCHNDCKINNLLVHRRSGKPLAVIDLDTCMPGAVLPDFGDLVRTCCSPEPEDSTRLDAVVARPGMYESLYRGYTEGWCGDLGRAELEALPEAGRMMSFVLGLRMLTDHLDGDRYFAVSRPNHNLDRARNQFRLHESLRGLCAMTN
jgi:Ser/Thr protein kinase RdoA (MazF antagonist)